jgi:hypothetical protein
MLELQAAVGDENLNLSEESLRVQP